MTMHPGTYLATAYLAPLGLSGDELTRMLGVPTIEVSKLILQETPMTAAMAVRLEAVFAKPAAEWLRMQLEYDIEQARKNTDVSGLTLFSRLNELWLTGIPERAGHYFWREGPGQREHRAELFYEAYGSQQERVIRCYSLTDVTFDDYAGGQWRLA